MRSRVPVPPVRLPPGSARSYACSLKERLSDREIAERLFVTERTVKFHVGSTLAKLGAENRTEAVTVAAQRGLMGYPTENLYLRTGAKPAYRTMPKSRPRSIL